MFFTICIHAEASDTLYIRDYLELITLNHPLIKKAEINDQIGEAYQEKAKGTLDPKIKSDLESKYFNNTDYFTIWNSEAKIPTVLPLDLSLGYEKNTGAFLNSENTVPENGLIYGTLNLSLIRGLLFDEQRYKLKRSELQTAKTKIEKEILIREIKFQAIKAYLNWSEAHAELELREQYLDLIRERHSNLIQLFLNGDKPAIDTVESRINLNSAEKYYFDSFMDLIDKKRTLSLFIWDAEGRPMEIQDQIDPESLLSSSIALDALVDEINRNFSNDPYIEKLRNEIETKQLKNRLEKEQLKPRLDLKYNTILDLGQQDQGAAFSFNDYKYGLSFEYPILNRKSKAEIKLNNAMIDQIRYESKQYEQKLLSKFEALNIQRTIQDRAIRTVNDKLTNSRLLYEAESYKFDIGESSVFILNQRELKLLEAQLDVMNAYKKMALLNNDFLYLKMGQS